ADTCVCACYKKCMFVHEFLWMVSSANSRVTDTCYWSVLMVRRHLRQTVVDLVAGRQQAILPKALVGLLELRQFVPPGQASGLTGVAVVGTQGLEFARKFLQAPIVQLAQLFLPIDQNQPTGSQA